MSSRAVCAWHGDRIGVALVSTAGEEPTSALLSGADDGVTRHPARRSSARARGERVLRRARERWRSSAAVVP